MKLGVFGGTFDPVHLGHLIIASEVTERVGLDRVLFVPAGDPWLKSDQKVSAADHRVEMVRLAISDDARFEPSAIEIERPGPTHTVDTVEALRQQYGEGAELHLILGADLVGELGRWYEAWRLLEQVMLIVVSRPGFEELDVEALKAAHSPAASGIVFVEGLGVGISSTGIRDRVTTGRSIRDLVPWRVEQYIQEHSLYREAA